MAHRTSAAMIQKSQMSYPPTENVSQRPKTIVPTAPTPSRWCPTLTTGAMRIVPSGVSVFRTATISTQNTTMPATYANALSTCSARIQSSNVTPADPMTRSARFET